MNHNFLTVFMVLAISAPVVATELARVGEVTISSEAFASALKALGQQGEMVASNPELRRRFLEHLINSRLVAVQAGKDGFDKNPTYQAHLADVSAQLLAGEFMDHQLDQQMTDANISKYFADHKEQFSKKQIHASHILLDTEDEAKKVLADLSKPGADFNKIAKVSSKDKNIDLGTFGHGRMVPEFEKVAFSLPKGGTTKEPVKTSFGWHIIKVIDIIGNDKVDFASVKDEVRKKYRQFAQEEFVNSLRAKNKIVINEQSIKEFKLP